MQRISSTGRKSDANLTNGIQRLDSMISEIQDNPSQSLAKKVLQESDQQLNLLQGIFLKNVLYKLSFQEMVQPNTLLSERKKIIVLKKKINVLRKSQVVQNDTQELKDLTQRLYQLDRRRNLQEGESICQEIRLVIERLDYNSAVELSQFIYYWKDLKLKKLMVDATQVVQQFCQESTHTQPSYSMTSFLSLDQLQEQNKETSPEMPQKQNSINQQVPAQPQKEPISQNNVQSQKELLYEKYNFGSQIVRASSLSHNQLSPTGFWERLGLRFKNFMLPCGFCSSQNDVIGSMRTPQSNKRSSNLQL